MSDTSERKRLCRLLIVEDDPSQLRTLTMIMQKEGFEVIGASTAAEALEHVAREDFGVAVVDLQLPDLTGTQLLAKIRALSGKIRIIIHTAYGSLDSAKQALNLGANGYVEKAGNPEELIRQVHAASRWQLDRYAHDLEDAVAERTNELREANKALRVELAERKRAEEALTVSEERYRTLAESARHMIFVIDWDMRVQYVNKCAADFLQGQPEEIAGKPLKDLFPPAHLEHMKPALRSVLESGEPFSAEDKLTLNGRESWLSTQLVPLRGPRGDVQSVLGISRDVTEAKRAEEALRETKEFLERLISSMRDGLSVLDSRGVHIQVNRAFCQMTGFSREELIGVGLPHPYWPPEEYKEIKTDFQKPVRGEFDDVEATFMRKNGERFPVILSPSSIKDGQGDVVCYFATVKDITERKQAEEALRTSEQQYRSLVDNVDLGITLINSDYEIVMTNAAQGALFNKPACAFVGKKCFAEFENRDSVCPFCPGTKAMASGRPTDAETEGVHDDGNRYALRLHAFPMPASDGTPTGFIQVVEDVTERKRAAEALRESEGRYRRIVETTSEGIWVIDAESNTMFANRRMAEMLGYALDEMSGKPLLDFMDEEWKANTQANLKRRQAGITEQHDFKFRRKDGGELWAIVTTNPIFDEGNNYIGALGMITDITERKRAEEELVQHRDHLEELVNERTRELEAALAELLRKERLATLGQLTATVSHELRNPLGTIRASFFAINDFIGGKGFGLDDVLERAERSIVRCDAIIEQLLDYARVKKPELSPTRIDEWLAHVLDEQTIPAGITLVRTLSSGIEATIDREHLRRSVVNIVANACQAMQENEGVGGRLTVETRTAGDRLEVHVIDTGPGIPPDRLERIFEPLYSTKGFGVGLGLPIVKQIMRMHGGGIEIESKPGEGTRTTLWLPLKEVTADEQQ